MMSSRFPREVETFGSRTSYNVVELLRLLGDFSDWGIYSVKNHGESERVAQERQYVPTGSGKSPLASREKLHCKILLAIPSCICS